MKRWFRALVCLSVAGLVVALYRADYLVVPELRRPWAALASLLALAAGFAGYALSWHRALARVGRPVALARSLASAGLSVLGQYLPGKVWLIAGRAAYVAPPGSGDFLAVSAASLGAQLGALWLGLGLGWVGLAALGAPAGWLVSVAALWAALTVVAFSAPAHAAALWVARAVLRRPLVVPLIDLADLAALIPAYALGWLSWSAGFYLLALAMLEPAPPLAVGLAYPLGAAAGMLAFFLPGGLGAREGVLGACLALAGVAPVDAASVAVGARLWSLAGELGFFAAGVVAHRRIA